jgi:hypothetical protein
MVKGFGFVEQGINILRNAEENKEKVSQIISNYPIWRINGYLSEMKWTREGDAYHKIIPFNNEKYLHFTLSPSIFDIEVVYHKILEGKIK